MKRKTKIKSKITQLVEVRTKIVLGIMLVSAYMVTASFAALPFKGINQNNKINYTTKNVQVVEKKTMPNYDDWGINELPRYWESDNGDTYVAGYILDRQNNTKDSYDYCSDYDNEGTFLVENSISGDWGMTRIVECEDGCYNGRCVYEYEVCPEQYECVGEASRALINNDCFWSDYETKDSNNWTCAGGEFYYIGTIPEETKPLAVCDLNNDSVRDLVDVSIFSQCQNTFDANNDGVHDLVDISLYAQNNQDDSWCRNNMFECYNVDTSTLGL